MPFIKLNVYRPGDPRHGAEIAVNLDDLSLIYSAFYYPNTPATRIKMKDGELIAVHQSYDEVWQLIDEAGRRLYPEVGEVVQTFYGPAPHAVVLPKPESSKP